jgi:Zn-dependent peptidase ImmA (M78 family)
VGSASLNTSEESLAKKIRQVLRVTLEEQVACQDRRQALNLWVERVEDAGISVCRAGGIEPEEARGITLTDEIAPFIFVNSHDAYAARLFTLVHELAHLWINQPGISNLQSIKQHATSGDPAIEAFCNRTAALTLVDSGKLTTQWEARDESKELEEQIEDVADCFNVSEEVIARRLLDRHIIRVVEYERLRQFYHARWLAHAAEEKRRQKESTGGPSYYRQKLQANGRSLTQTVIGACSTGNITLRDACSILGVRVGHLSKLATIAGLNLSSIQGGSR